MLPVEEADRAIRAAFRPPPKLSLSEWCERHAYLSAESSAEAGKWHNIPYQVGIMDAFTDPEIERITFMKSARVGWTKILNNAIGYFIHQDPCPVMLVQPTIEDAEGYSKEEIAPMVRDTPVLRELVSDSKVKSSDNTILQKLFPGGSLSMVGANSPRGFRRVSRRVVLFDETDGYPPSAGAEGDQIKLGIKRTEYYWNRKIADGSTPTVDEVSRIQKAFREGDQRRFFVPCPHCDAKQFLKWGGKDDKFGVKWPEGEPRAAYYVCEGNGCIIDHSEKRGMIESAARRQKEGEEGIGWVATVPGNGGGRHASFHLWAAYSYSPNATWGHLASEFLDAKEDPLKLKTFVNTTLGECWEEEYSARLGAGKVADRAESYRLTTVPMGGLVLVAAVDVQGNRLEVKVKAFGVDEESWLVDYQVIQGDPTDTTSSGPWAAVDNLLRQEFEHESGAKLKIRAMAVDTGGHHTQAAYAFCRARKPVVIAIKGASLPGRPALGKPSKQDVNHKGQVIKKGVELRLVGTDTIKATVYARLKKGADSGAGAMHFPVGLPQDYYKQLTVEKQQVKYRNGHAYRVWVKPDGARNEALDLEVYCYAALEYLFTRHNRNTIWLQAKELLAKLSRHGNGNGPAAADIVASPSSDPPPVPPRPTNRPPSRRRKSGGFATNWRK